MIEQNNGKRIKFRDRISKIWLGFVVLVFLSMLLTAAVITPVLLYFFRHELISLHMKRPSLTVIIFLIASVLISTAITFLLAKKILRPIMDISEATKEIAKGDFKVRINERHRLTELSRLAADFNKMVQELGGMETLRSDFVVNVSHEFKTPLSAIEGFAALLKDESLSGEERREYATLIGESSRQLTCLLENILMLSRLESQEILTEKSVYRLDEQIRRIILSLEPLWSEKELELNIRMDTAYYHGSESLLAQVWFNLLGNAIKFTDRGGGISVDLSELSGSITIRISDTGIGISDEEKRHIFNRFFRTNAAYKYSGNGLGLALVKRILDLSGADIFVESEAGRGTEFIIILPKI